MCAMAHTIQPDDELPKARLTRAVTAAAIFTVAIHLITNIATPYGVHRDEFLYLAMGRHLDLFRMEFPPAIAIIAKVSMLFGDSLVAVRMFPAIASGVLVLVAGLTAAELGGSKYTQLLAAIAILASPLFLRAGNLFQPVVFDQLWWTLGLFSLVRLSRTNNPRWWLAYGIAAGLGLLTKFSAVFFGGATLIALVVSPQRKWLVTPWPWLALALVAVIGSPSWIGQLRLDFPVIKQMSDLQAEQLERVSPVDFITGQVRLGPSFLMALAGVVWLLVAPATRRFRIVGWTSVFAFVILLVLKGKPYYLGPVYPVLFGAGAVALERVARGRFPSSLPLAIASVLVMAYGILLLPIGIPILPPERMSAYTDAIGASEANRTNTGELDRLPQDYADMFGWPEQAKAVARVYGSLSAAERNEAVILAGNYGEAGALDFYGRRLGLPSAISAAGTYWFFGPGVKRGSVVVTIGIPGEDLSRFFEETRLATTVTHPWAVSEERDVPIYIARRPRKTLQEVWPSLAGQN